MVMTVKKISTSLAILGALTVAACGQGGDAEDGPDGTGNAGTSQVDSTAPMPDTGGQTAQATGEVHSGAGDITEVSGDRVTLSHGPVESIGWPAMTMTFRAGSPEMVQGLNVGDPVSFQFRQAGEEYVLTSIDRVQQ